MKKPELVLRDVELMRAGTWGGYTFTEDDLARIAEDTNAIHGRIKPPLTVGLLNAEEGTWESSHPKPSTIEAMRKVKTRRGPAVGWLGPLAVEGGALKATVVTDLHEGVAGLIESRAYKRLSAGLRRNYLDASAGKTYPWIVDHAAILGAEKPVIDTLRDLPLPERLAASEREEDNEIVLYSGDDPENDARTEVEMADEKDAAAEAAAKTEADAKAAAEAKANAAAAEAATAAAAKAVDGAEKATSQVELLLKGMNERIAAIETRNKYLEAALAKKDADALTGEARAIVAAAVADGKITPAEVAAEEALGVGLAEKASSLMVNFAEGDKTVERSAFDLWKERIKNRRRAPIFSEVSPSTGYVASDDLDEGALRRIGVSKADVEKANKSIKDGTFPVVLDASVERAARVN